MSGWGVLPLLPLRCVLEHLGTEDALHAMSVCRHWRMATLLYEGYKETLKLEAKQLEKNMFLLRLFRKHVSKIHVHLDCNEAELDKFMTYVAPQFFDAVNLKELLFIGPSYMKQYQHNKLKLKRIITESLVFKQLRSLQTLALLGCEIDTAKNDHDRYTSKQIEYYSRPLSFAYESSPADAILSRNNASMIIFSAMQHIIVDYDQLSTDALQTLSHLTMFSHLTIVFKYEKQLEAIDWHTVQACYPNGLEVSVVVIGLSTRRIQEIINVVLVDGLNLISLKMLFCNKMYTPLLTHAADMFSNSLRELVWADAPTRAPPRPRTRRRAEDSLQDEINPFILLCWQCTHLRRLVIHGYWIWQYDVVGFSRLRKSLLALEVSGVDARGGRDARVRCGDLPRWDLPQRINEFTDFQWTPTDWNSLHPALRSSDSSADRTDYIVQEILRTHTT